MERTIIFEKVPTVEKPVVYLDHNIFSMASEDLGFKNTLVSLVRTGKYIFPFTQVHISEVNRITGTSREEDVKTQLSIIKEISCSNYLDYRAELGCYTIRARDPNDVYESINEVPESYLDEISKLATEQHLEGQIPNFPENCYRMADQYKFFTETFRKQFPNLSKEINNLSKDEAKKYLEEKVFQMSFEQFFDILEKSQKGFSSAKSLTLDFLIKNTLFLAGYKTPNKDLKKPSGLLSDHQHLHFASCCSIIISDDKNFRQKALEFTEAKLVADPSRGINFLLVHSGLVNMISEQTGESLNQKYLTACLYRAPNHTSKKTK